MLAHMVLTMMVPLLLVPGAPVTLALRAIRKRSDGSRGAREWILLAVHSRFADFITNPIVAAILFAGSLWLFYYTPLFRWATTDHVGHEWMITHFLITGYLFVQSLIGIDPVKYRLAYPFRLLLLLGTMAFHAFFGLSIMTNQGLLLADWFGAMGRTWGATPLVDQQTGGGIAWSVGEIPTVILAIVVAIQWSRSDDTGDQAPRPQRRPHRRGRAERVQRASRQARAARRRIALSASALEGQSSTVMSSAPSSKIVMAEIDIWNGSSDSRCEMVPSNSDCTLTERCATPSAGVMVQLLLAGDDRDRRIVGDRPRGQAENPVVDGDAERAPGGLQHLLLRASVEVGVELLVDLGDEGGVRIRDHGRRRPLGRASRS